MESPLQGIWKKRLLKATTNAEKQEIKLKLKEATKASNIIQFSSKKETTEGNYERTEGDDKLIKRAFKAYNALRIPPYYRQTALFTLTKNFLTDKQRYMIESNNDPNIRDYIKLCSVCLEEEDSVLHRMYECPPVQYMADVVTRMLSMPTTISP